VIEPYLDYVIQFTQAQKLGNGLDQHTTVGPLINNRQRDRLEKMVQESVAQGAQLSTGGHRPAHLPQGYFYEPTVLTNVYPGMPIYDEEIFGPVLPVIPFNDVEEVLTLANQTEYGLAAFVHTQDLNTALLVSERLEYGMVCVNDWLPATPEAPFGGVKQSGLGRESGSEGLFEYLEEKTTFFGGVI
jgi:acyl-CoA reductase-like NAD-dependent aldehyde dehydrogenase